MGKKKIYLGIIIFGLIGIMIYCLPDIYNYAQKLDHVNVPNEKKEDNDSKKELETITKDSEIIKSLTIPVMRNNIYEINSYYQLDSITLENFTNNDILYNALIDLYDGYIVDHNKVGCASESKEVLSSYLVSRIKNVIGRNAKYSKEDFIVPNYSLSAKYVGKWKYDEGNDSYIYYGDCNYGNTSTIYYNLENLNSVEPQNNNSVLYLYYDVAFAKIIKTASGYSYTIYTDADMQNEIQSGNINDIEEINNIFNNYIKDNKVSMYKYTFKKGLCTYDNYCFYKGEWVK